MSYTEHTHIQQTERYAGSEYWFTLSFPRPELQDDGTSPETHGAETTGKQTQVGTKSALSRHQVGILRKCLEDQPITVLMEVVGRSDRTKFRNLLLAPLLEQGLIEMTIPDKPRSSKQRYRLTAPGRQVLEQRDKESS